MCAPSPPAPPDYSAAATAQGAANKEAALATGQLSNPNINSPAGARRVTYTTDPVTGNPIPTITDSYAPGQQALYDKDIALKGLMADLGIGAAGKAQGILGSPVDFSGAPAAPGGGEKTRQQVYDAMMARVNTDYDRQLDNTNSNLVARGIPVGSKAYAREMEMLDRGRNDARNVAIQGSGQEAQRDFGMDMDARRQAITEILAKRQTPINEISAFRSGSQISPLTFQPYTGATVGPAPVMQGAIAQGQAQQNAYNAEVANSNAMMSGLFQLGSAGIGLI